MDAFDDILRLRRGDAVAVVVRRLRPPGPVGDRLHWKAEALMNMKPDTWLPAVVVDRVDGTRDWITLSVLVPDLGLMHIGQVRGADAWSYGIRLAGA